MSSSNLRAAYNQMSDVMELSCNQGHTWPLSVAAYHAGMVPPSCPICTSNQAAHTWAAAHQRESMKHIYYGNPFAHHMNHTTASAGSYPAQIKLHDPTPTQWLDETINSVRRLAFAN